jgi:arylsulfatase A-like enzyme
MRSLLLIAALTVTVLLLQGGDAGVPVLGAHLLPPAASIGLPFLAGADDYECLGCSVILISIDTLRADHLGCYGYGRDTSPNIDLFSRDAVVFRNAIAQAPSTVRSHSSIMTSLFNFQHQARHLPMFPLPESAVTIAEVLSREGYQTAAFTGSGQTHPEYGLGQGFDSYHHRDRRGFDDVVAHAIDWLEEAPRGKFFLFLHTYEVHTPYTPSQKYLDMFPPEPESGLPEQIPLPLLEELQFNFFGRRSYSAADLRQITRSYDAEIRSVDDAFGHLVEYLRSSDQYDDLLIVFTSDHGEEFGEHDKIARHSHALHDVLLKVPLIVRFPWGAFAPRMVNPQVRSIDIAPTIADVVAIEAPPSFQGVSLVDIVTGRMRDTLVAISERGLGRASIAIRTDRWKLYDGELFDLVADPGEQMDVSESYPTVRAAMEELLVEILSSGEVLDAAEVAPSEEILKQLRALGYVQ